VEVAVDESKAVDVVLRAGEMSLHHINIIHGSNPNLSNHDRIGFIARFAAPGTSAGTQVLRAKKGGGYERTNLLRRPIEPVMEEVVQSYKEFLYSDAQTRRLRAD
jgi:hypothetical protein